MNLVQYAAVPAMTLVVAAVCMSAWAPPAQAHVIDVDRAARIVDERAKAVVTAIASRKRTPAEGGERTRVVVRTRCRRVVDHRATCVWHATYATDHGEGGRTLDVLARCHGVTRFVLLGTQLVSGARASSCST